MDESILQELYTAHLVYLKNKEISNPKLMIAFSAIPGSGKSTIAKALEKRFNAVRIENDFIRDKVIKKLYPDIQTPDVNKLLLTYLKWLILKLTEMANGFVILDASIDRVIKLVKATAEENLYPLYIIRLEIPLEVIKNNIRERGDERQHEHIEFLDKYKNEFENALTEMAPSYVVNLENRNDLNRLYSAIMVEMGRIELPS